MRDYRDAKAMAQSLRKALAANGVTQTHSQCLELIAHAFGLDNWNTLLAKIEAAEPDSPALPVESIVVPGRPQRVLRAQPEGAEVEGTLRMPVVPVRDIVILPGMTVPLWAGRPKTVRAVEHAATTDQRVFLIAQKRSADEAPTAADLHEIGVIGEVVQFQKLSDPRDTIKVLVKAGRRARLARLHDGEMLEAQIETFDRPAADETLQTVAREALEQFWRSANLDPSHPPLALMHLRRAVEQQPASLADEIAPLVVTGFDQAQVFLEITSPVERLKKLIALMGDERRAA